MSLTNLAAELLHEIVKQLDFQTQLRLSCTCSEFRAFLAPHIFKSVTFSNNAKTADSALAAIEAYGQYTTELRLVVHIPAEGEEGFVT